MGENDKIPEYTEWETKYRIDGHNLFLFKQVVSQLSGVLHFLYVEGPDFYYINPDREGFARYRKPSFGLDNNRAEITVKFKPKNAKNNIIRKEINVRVDNTPQDAVKELIQSMGYEFNFSIYKSCQIYKMHDATLVFYTVYDTTDGKPKNQDSFVEIELDEEKIKDMTEKEAWAVIEKYEKILEPIGINSHKRLRKSLFEMYSRRKQNE
jgi:predicted adenylyl cyclase CyaB